MAKRKIKVTIGDKHIKAGIWEMDDLHWNNSEIACPYCREFAPVNAKIDVIQYGLMNADNVHTVVECPKCHQFWAMHYLNTYEVTE